MVRTLSAAALALAVAAPVAAAPAKWNVDTSHSQATFAVKHLVVTTVRGELGKVTGSATLDPADPGKSSVEVEIDVKAINTREEKRDAHLRSADFFDADKFPTIKFKSKKAEKAGEGKLKVTGDLTMRGVTKEVVLDVEGGTQEIKDPWGMTRMGFTATTKLNRKEFGVSWNKNLDNGGVVVSDEVAVLIEVELIKDAPKPAKP